MEKLKIVLASPQDNSILGRVGLYCHKALAGFGHTVVDFDFSERLYSRNKVAAYLKRTMRPLLPCFPSPYDLGVVRSANDRRLNERLLELVSAFRPHLFLVLLGETIAASALEKIKREYNPVVAHWMFDSILLPYRRELLQQTAPAYDLVFLVESPEVLALAPIPAKRIETLPLAQDPQIFKRIPLSSREKDKYGSDVAFIGTITPERQAFLEALLDFDIKLWGIFKCGSRKLRRVFQPMEVGPEIAVKIYNASKIVIDVHNLFGRAQELFNVSQRVFEVPASGGFLLPNHVAQISGLFRAGEEMVTYRSLEELLTLIKYFLQHESERSAIAARAFARAHSEHTYSRRIGTLLEKAMGKAAR